MKLKSLISLSLIFLLLFPCIVSADTGKARVIHTNDDGSKTDITDDNYEESDDDTPHASDDDDENEAEEEKSSFIESDATGAEVVSDAVTNGGINIGYRIGDEFLEGGFKLASIDIEERQVTGEKTMTYSLYSKKLNPFEDASVRKTVIMTYICHVVVAIVVILFGVCRYVAQTVWPRKTTQTMAGFSGEYTQFDIVCFLVLAVGVIIMPVCDLLGISYCLLNRNVMAGLMTIRTLDIVGATTESLPTYILVNAAWYFNNLEKLFGEYAVNTMTKLLIVKTWVQAAIVIIGSLKKAAVLQVGVMVGFILVLFMDIITLFFVSSGIDYGVNDGNWGHALIGMGLAAVIDFLIILFIVVFPFVILYARIRSGRIGGSF